MNKKGALELSINAIVIIILAIVLLGLALAFIQKLFNFLPFAQTKMCKVSHVFNDTSVRIQR